MVHIRCKPVSHDYEKLWASELVLVNIGAVLTGTQSRSPVFSSNYRYSTSKWVAVTWQVWTGARNVTSRTEISYITSHWGIRLHINEMEWQEEFNGSLPVHFPVLFAECWNNSVDWSPHLRHLSRGEYFNALNSCQHYRIGLMFSQIYQHDVGFNHKTRMFRME